MNDALKMLSQWPTSSSGRRVAFFGGSFDPPHLGHLAVARAAQAALSLDAVLFAPVGAQPLKPRGASASFDDRVAMTRLAIADLPGFALSLADAPHPSGAPNYTLETLAALSAQLVPGTLFCLMGADSFAALPHWHRAAEIPFVAPLIVASRSSPSGWPLDDLKSALPTGLTIEADLEAEQQQGWKSELRCYLLRNPKQECVPFYLLPGLHIEISASQIRDGIHAAELRQHTCDELLSEAVFHYIRDRGLYR